MWERDTFRGAVCVNLVLGGLRGVLRLRSLAQVEIHSVKLDAKQREDYDVLYQSLKRTVDR